MRTAIVKEKLSLGRVKLVYFSYCNKLVVVQQSPSDLQGRPRFLKD
jgi:hypothetical protein